LFFHPIVIYRSLSGEPKHQAVIMGRSSKRTLHVTEIAIRREAAKRAKREETCMDELSEKDIEDVAEDIRDSSSEEEPDLEISDTDEPEFDQYVPSCLDSGCGKGLLLTYRGNQVSL